MGRPIKLPDGTVVLAELKPGAKLTQEDERILAEWVQYVRDRSEEKRHKTAVELDATPLQRPLEGATLTRKIFGGFDHLKRIVRLALSKRALVCLSPNRTERCDSPATGIFWQDQAEWYPCCDAHWPEGRQWAGSTRWAGVSVELQCFNERLDEALVNGGKVESYDRSTAT